MTQFNYCKATFCRHLLFLALALSFGFTAQAKDNTITLPPTSPPLRSIANKCHLRPLHSWIQGTRAHNFIQRSV